MPSNAAAGNAVTSAMVGQWEGTAHIIVNWVQQTNLPVQLHIASDGTVTGKIGEAVVNKGRIRNNRGSLGRKINIKTDYIIEARLTGTLIAAEDISRAGVKMPINFTGTNLIGGLHTTGSKFGRKERGIVSARLTLQRSNERDSVAQQGHRANRHARLEHQAEVGAAVLGVGEPGLVQSKTSAFPFAGAVQLRGVG